MKVVLTGAYSQVEHFTRYGLKEVQIEMEDGNGSTRPPLRVIHEVRLTCFIFILVVFICC